MLKLVRKSGATRLRFEHKHSAKTKPRAPGGRAAASKTQAYRLGFCFVHAASTCIFYNAYAKIDANQRGHHQRWHI